MGVINMAKKIKLMSKKKKIIIITSCLVLSLILIGLIIAINLNKLPNLPKPEITSGIRGELGIDKNINESNIDKYLGRSDSVYRDMRMLEDPATYESIGGDRFLSGYINGFEVIPLPYIIPVTNLPKEVGDTYIGNTLFHNDNGKYVANYKESMKIIEKVFPKDKVIFLMCGGGGYAGMTKNFLVSLGWDENKIYNVGGYWYYKGKNNISVKKTINGNTSYDFSNVPYHKIEFDKLTKSKKYKTPNIKVTEIKLNTSKIELEENSSFKLNAIVLPNEATNKSVKWTSSDNSIATVDTSGLVKALKQGKTTIKVETIDGNKTALCDVIVKKKEIIQKIKLDNLVSEINEFSSYNIDKLNEDFYNRVDIISENSKYYTVTPEGGYLANDLWKEEYNKLEIKKAEYQNKRLEIFNKVVDAKKSFIVLVHTKECDVRDYEVIDGAARVLDRNGYVYFKVGNSVSNGEETLEKSHLDTSNFNWSSSVIIVKDGSIYATINPDVDSIKSDEDTKNWLNKYINVR